MKNSFLAVLIAPLLITALAACEGRSAGASAAGPVTISFWHSAANEAGAAINRIAADFNAGPGKEKGITVEAVFQGQNADAAVKLNTVLQSDVAEDLPDVMQIDATGIVSYMNSEYAFTVDDALAKYPGYDLEQLLPAPLAMWNFGGRQLGFPITLTTSVMYYNKTILDAAGISEPPTTFGELIDAARKLPKTNPDGQPLTAYAQIPNTPLLANWIGQIPGKDGAGSSYVVNNRNGRDGIAGKLVCDTEGTLELFLSAWKELYDAGAVANISDSLNDLFLTQQTVFLTANTSQLAGLLAQAGGRFEVACTYYPRINDRMNFGAGMSGSGIFMFNKGVDRRTAAAWEFVRYVLSPSVQANLSAATGYFPGVKAAFEDPAYLENVEKFPQFKVGSGQLSRTSPDMLNVTVGPSRDFYMEIMNQISNMLINNIEPSAAAKTMADSLNAVLAEYTRANP
ncbi:MAG: extracellular solute-binding protein [Treponema sp.]|jgi:sn-glycerol 3-phosphate transport system substrate-binding protein|nr:extracellular solute-binding protein [Treponema sp.]